MMPHSSISYFMGPFTCGPLTACTIMRAGPLAAVAALLQWVLPAVVQTVDLSVQMPDIVAAANLSEVYLCTAVRLRLKENGFAVQFRPEASMTNVHHMLLHGCPDPGSLDEVWDCGHDPVDGLLYAHGPVCGGALAGQIIYGWARDAPTLTLPDNVGFAMGPDYPFHFLVLQVHYKNLHQGADRSGVHVTITHRAQAYQAGVFVLGHVGDVAPQSTSHLESWCTLPEVIPLIPFAFRVHTHQLGQVVSGYRVSPDGYDWQLIGKMDPQLPQMFYKLESGQAPSIRSHDQLAIRCTMVSDRDRITLIGPRSDDEMCNFYLMYYYNASQSAQAPLPWTLPSCWGDNGTKWRDRFPSGSWPPDASQFTGGGAAAGRQ